MELALPFIFFLSLPSPRKRVSLIDGPRGDIQGTQAIEMKPVLRADLCSSKWFVRTPLVSVDLAIKLARALVSTTIFPMHQSGGSPGDPDQ